MAISDTHSVSVPANLPRITIAFCTQCRWMLRAAYFAQELLSTFGTSIGEVALQPTTGGLFQVHITYKPQSPQNRSEDGGNENAEASESKVETQTVLLWDRKAECGFPETKVLKQKVRDCIEPEKDLGHSDKNGKVKKEESAAQERQQQGNGDGIGEAPCA